TAVPDATAGSGAARTARGPAVAAERRVADRQHCAEVAEAAALNVRSAGRRGCGEHVSAEHAVTDRDGEAVAPASSGGGGESAPGGAVGAGGIPGAAGVGDRLDPAGPDAAGVGAGTRGRAVRHACGDVVVADDTVGKRELTVVTDAATERSGISD